MSHKKDFKIALFKNPQPIKPQQFMVHVPSLVLGFGLALLGGFSAQMAGAFNLNAIAKSATNLVNIKKNLDSDIKLLTADAKKLMGSKDQLFQIKDKLMTLAKDTKTQVDSIQTLVQQVEGQIKATEANIATTAAHVGEIDEVRKALSMK